MMHRLLQKQIKKFLGEIPPGMENFFNAINEAYEHYEDDRTLLTRSIEISSEELSEVNQKLKESAEKHKEVLKKLISFVASLGSDDNLELQTDDLLKVANQLEMQIRERKFFEAEVQKNQANLRSLIENTQDAIWSVKNDLSLITFNTRFLRLPFLKSSVRPYEEYPILPLWKEEYRNLWESYHQKCLNGERFVIEIEEKSNGVTQYFEASFNPIKEKDGTIVGATIYCKDITERKQIQNTLVRAKEAAESANRAKNEFLANISHELRTPLNAIIGYSELLQEEALEVGKNDTINEDLKKITAAGKHLLALIDSVLDITRIEAGRFDLNIQKVQLLPFLEEIKVNVNSLTQNKNVSFDIQCNSDQKEIETDEKKLRQVLLNLLSNAVKFTREGKIQLKVSVNEVGRENWFLFEIKDTGIGIPKEKLPLIWEHFSQVDTSPRRLFGGAGIGLSVTKRYVEILGGKISVESELNVGSTFTVEIPFTFHPPKIQMVHHYIRFET